MYVRRISLAFFLLIILSSLSVAQSSFTLEQYAQFLAANRNLAAGDLLARHEPAVMYYRLNETPFSIGEYTYLDSVIAEYGLTAGELSLLGDNRFLVTERLSFNTFGEALHDIYHKDLPVMLTTDAVLHALHMSYDKILKELEKNILKPNLLTVTSDLYSSVPDLAARYGSNLNLRDALEDADLYVTIAYSLLMEELQQPHFAAQEDAAAVWNAIQAESYTEMPLYSDRNRDLDFSQFTVRGHYTDDYPKLDDYFKCMMWLDRIEFFMTPPPENPWEPPWTKEEIRRMNLGAFLLNELIDTAGVRELLTENDEIITFLVGESDNLTPGNFTQIVHDMNIADAAALLDDTVYDQYYDALFDPAYGQRILSNIIIMDPNSADPDTLSVSFRLMGQKFIIDSYVFSNVVYDRIIYQNEKIWRPMPDPLDALFVLGNDDALQLLSGELEQYKYSSQLSALRYLVDAYDDDFWGISLYNTWLNAIRELNPGDSDEGLPYFMRTTAWHQQKMNTQLASWAQLRHDNLLYAKQSYTGGSRCSYPHSYVEPYPAFYRRIGEFADAAYAYFSSLGNADVNWYFERLSEHMEFLENLAVKELNGTAFSAEEIDTLKRMLFISTGSGAPPFDGWYSELYFNKKDAAKGDFVIADVHTQPTDEPGNFVGNVLHVGTGRINLGVFLAPSPSDGYEPMAYVGPCMTYYERITSDFQRLTDEQWTESVESGTLPDRPDYVNAYLADADGNTYTPGRMLQGAVYTGASGEPGTATDRFTLHQNYPNPFNPVTRISFDLPRAEYVTVTVYDQLGREVTTLAAQPYPAGTFSVLWDGTNTAGSRVASGLYFYRITAGSITVTGKMALLK